MRHKNTSIKPGIATLKSNNPATYGNNIIMELKAALGGAISIKEVFLQ